MFTMIHDRQENKTPAPSTSHRRSFQEAGSHILYQVLPTYLPTVPTERLLIEGKPSNYLSCVLC